MCFQIYYWKAVGKLSLSRLLSAVSLGALVFGLSGCSSGPDTPTAGEFYQKFLDASGIPIVSSSKVSDEALKAAGEIVTEMVGARPDIRAAMISRGARLAVMDESEVTTDIPEHAFLKRDQNTDWDQRARGLGGTLSVPTGSAAEENLLCKSYDRYHGENILVHEFAHSIMNLGVPFVERGPELLEQLDQAYNEAIEAGLWSDTYAATDVEEYWAEGVQSWLNANQYSSPPNGIHNHVDTREALKEYDPQLASLIGEVLGEDWSYTCPQT